MPKKEQQTQDANASTSSDDKPSVTLPEGPEDTSSMYAEMAGDTDDSGGQPDSPPVDTGKKDSPSDKSPPEPPPEHPRFREIYGKMKGYERELESTQRVMEAMAEHNKQLADSLDRLQVSQATHNMPDPSADPAGYHNFLMDTMGNLIKKHMAPPPEFKARPLPDDADTPVPTSPQDNVAHNRFVAQEIAMQSIHDDYDTVVAEVNKIIQVDPAVSHRIYSSTNPPKEAYRVGREILSAKEKQVSDRRSQGYVESSGLSPAPSQDNDHKLTADEKKVAAMLGISPEKYAKQKNAIAKAKTGR